MRAKKLPMSLEGEAMATWLELSGKQHASYSTTKTENVWGQSNFFQLRQTTESLSIFMYELKRLIDQAMPDTDHAKSYQSIRSPYRS